MQKSERTQKSKPHEHHPQARHMSPASFHRVMQVEAAHNGGNRGRLHLK